MITETVYLNRDNIISLVIKARAATSNDATEQDISACSRMQLQVADTVIDSQTSLTAFDWTTNGANGQLDLDIGFEKGLSKWKPLIKPMTKIAPSDQITSKVLPVNGSSSMEPFTVSICSSSPSALAHLSRESRNGW